MSELLNLNASVPGRQCPLAYRYGPEALALAPTQTCDTLYVIGGLYGNPYALEAILTLAKQESGPVTLCFNGDFNWFNVGRSEFAALNAQVLEHDCVLGNVEFELLSSSEVPDCGCAYPDEVDQAVVDRSNQIHSQLKRTAQLHPQVLARLQAQPLFRRYQLGDLRVGVVHGDSESLAGWRFDPKCLQDKSQGPWLQQQFRRANVDVFASSHTCSAAFHIQPLGVNSTAAGLISNNGAAGMPSVKGSLGGVITRISALPSAQGVHRFYGMKGHVVEQVVVEYDQEAWQQEFERNWPVGSAAHLNYAQRITAGV